MKKFILFIVIALLTIILSISFFKINFEKSVVENLREKHLQFLEESPFKQTLKFSKEERKLIGLPPNKYYEREWELTMNPATGKPEPNKVLEIQKRLRDKSVGAKNPGDEVSNGWVDRGPNNVGGRTRVVLFDPNDSNNEIVYAGGVSGGLWKNLDITDPNSTWTQVSGVPGNMNISCITVDPNDSNIWYIGTGEQYTFGAAVGNGVYKTTDGGVNWVNVPVQVAGSGNLSSSSAIYFSGIYYINDIIAWDNGSSTEVFIGVGGHAYGDASNKSNRLGLQSAGLYKTLNGGTTWSRIESTNMEFTWSGVDFYFIPTDFEISFDNKLWMGTITTPYIGGNGGGRVFSSTDGSTWTEAAGSPLTTSNRVELAVSSTVANKLYALTQGDGTDPHIFVTTDGFATSTELATPNDADTGIPSTDFTRGQDFYDLVIEVDPVDDDIVYVGGIDLFRTDQGADTNLASEWEQISKWSNNNLLSTLNCSFVHADQHAFTFRPGNSNEAVIGCDGGVYYVSDLLSAESSDVFTAMNTDYNVTQFYFGGYGQSSGNELIVAGAQDNGTQFINGAVAGANPTIAVRGGDGAYSTIDKDGDYMIASYVYGNHDYKGLPYPGTNYTIDDNDDEGDFINPAGLDHNLNILYSNGSDANKEINRYTLGANSAVKAQLSNALLDGSPTAFKASPYTLTSTTLLVGTDNGKLLKLTNANQVSGNITWEDISGGSFVGSISSVEFGETENDIFITFHNYAVTSVWYTSNGGASWKDKEGTLPDMPVKCLLQNPLARNEVIIGTELGIWATKNFNEDAPSWTSSNNGMRDVKVVDLDLRTSDNNILATTHGRGVFTGKFASSTDPTFTITAQNSIVNVCKPDDAVFNFDFTANGGYNTATTFSTSGEPAGAIITFNPTSLSTTNTFTMTVNTTAVAAAEYIITVTGTGAETISTDVVLIVQESTLGIVDITAPADEATAISTSGTFTWDSLSGATSYEIDISTDAGFTTIIESGETANTSYSNVSTLNLATVYYWRVRAKNSCADGDFSETKRFQTNYECISASNNTSVAIPDGAGVNVGGVEATSIINITENIVISKVTINVDISHTYVKDLKFYLIAPDATEVLLFNKECDGEEDLDITYDDDASTSIACASPISGTYIPSELLSGFNGVNSVGDWTLKVVDYDDNDTGDINSWSIDICSTQALTNSTFTNSQITVGTNSTYVLKQAETEATSIGSTASEQLFMMVTLPTVGEVRLSNTQLVLGETFTQDDINTSKITYVNSSGVSTTDSFKVDITNATNGFSPNEELIVTIDAALAIDNYFFEKTGISVYPTVSNGNFSISSSKGIGKTTIEMYSIIGQKVFAQEINFNRGNIEKINAEQLASGIYILKLTSKNMQGSKKILIN